MLRVNSPHQISKYCLVGTLLFLLSSGILAQSLTASFQEKLFTKRPPLYLPEPERAKIMAFGYPTALGKVLWFNLLNYFGKEFSTVRDYTWFKHMCETVIELDPKVPHYYRLCATLLAWEIKNSNAASGILEKAAIQFPNDYYFTYQQGFNTWYFEENFEKAAKYFSLSARKPNAPPFVSSLASKILTEAGQIDSAIQFLQDAIEKAESQSSKDSLRQKLKQARLKKHLDFLAEAKLRYQTRYEAELTNIEDLVNKDIITMLPKEPFGGRYTIQDSNVISTSGEAPLEFKGKTAKTGLLKNEFGDDSQDKQPQ